jgi:hypothetical protein
MTNNRKPRIINGDKKKALLDSLYDPQFYAPKLTVLSRRHEVAISTVHEFEKRLRKEGTKLLSPNRRQFSVSLHDLPGFLRTIIDNGGSIQGVTPTDTELLRVEVTIDG